jgi:hypothetical protein
MLKLSTPGSPFHHIWQVYDPRDDQMKGMHCLKILERTWFGKGNDFYDVLDK